MRRLLPTLCCVLACAAAPTASAVIHLDTGDPALYTSTPGDNSGWQYEGRFGGFLGTPIAPHYFLTAAHIYRAGDTFIFHGETFTVLESHPDPSTDLCLWRVDQAFATYAPLFLQPRIPGDTETGRELRVFGCGTQRGAEIIRDDTLRGWAWGPGDGVERWGRNTVAAVLPNSDADDEPWRFLRATFDVSGPPGEAHLSGGDSGGGVFVLQDGLWRLAGINYAVDDLFGSGDGGGGFAAALFDARGYYNQTGASTFALITGADNVPTSFYSTQVSTRLAWIAGIIGTDADLTTLPAENFDRWEHAYLTPDQLADATVAGTDADPDGDGVPNLLEYAFNLDPTYAEPVVMTAGTGLRGLPLVRLETLAGSDRRLTVEFVRRTAAGGAGVTYAVQFTSDPGAAGGGWQTGGTENITAINPRWERVKVTDSIAPGGTGRFARVLVSRDAVPAKVTPVTPASPSVSTHRRVR